MYEYLLLNSAVLFSSFLNIHRLSKTPCGSRQPIKRELSCCSTVSLCHSLSLSRLALPVLPSKLQTPSSPLHSPSNTVAMAANESAAEAWLVVDSTDAIQDGDSNCDSMDSMDSIDSDDTDDTDGANIVPSPSLPPTLLPQGTEATPGHSPNQPSTTTQTQTQTQTQTPTRTTPSRPPRPRQPRPGPQPPTDTANTILAPLPLPPTTTRTRRLRGDVRPKDPVAGTPQRRKRPTQHQQQPLLPPQPTPLLDLQPLPPLGPILRPAQPLPPGRAPPGAMLAVQLKVNLEIEVTIKARVCGDILLSVL